MFKQNFPSEMDKDLAYFLAAPIVLDSNFFEPLLKGSKWTEKDLEVHQWLATFAPVGKEFHHQLAACKTNEELNLNLGIRNNLIKDLKVYTFGESKIAVSSIVVSIFNFENHFGLEKICESMTSLMKENGL